MNKKIGALMIFGIFMISFASAEIFFTKHPSNFYTLGEDLTFSVGTDGTTGWLQVDLACQNQTKMLYYHYLTDEDVSTDVTASLTKDFLRGLSGTCHLSLKFNEDMKNSMEFEISDSLEVEISFNDLIFEPNSTVEFTGTASKQNGQKVYGLIEISIDGTEISIVEVIEKNKFSGAFLLPDAIAAGEYNMNVFAYEKNDNDEITNFGLSNMTITISQKPTKLEIETSKTASPDSDLELKATLYDQTEQTIDGSPVSFDLVDVYGESVVNVLSKTGDSEYYKLRKNAPRGYWNLTAESGELIEQVQVFIDENKEAMIVMVNDTVLIRNVGNVPYDKMVEIQIGENYTQVKNLNLSLGRSVEFLLNAPDGEYDIKIDDGGEPVERTGVALTGEVISIEDLSGNSFLLFRKSYIIWIFLIMVFGFFVYASGKRMINKKAILKVKNLNFFKKGKKLKLNNQTGFVNVGEGIDTGKKNLASHSLVLNGEKQRAGLISLKIKNYAELKNSKSNASEIISQAVKQISENKGKVYKVDDYIVGIFTPAITRTFNNEFNAVKTAQGISDKLNEYNNQSENKILFGIGVGAGEIIAKNDSDGKLLFTPLGSGLAGAKKISEIAENNVLLGEAIQKKLMSSVKTAENPEKFGMKTYSVFEIIDREQNQKFIAGFLKRNSEYKELSDSKL